MKTSRRQHQRGFGRVSFIPLLGALTLALLLVASAASPPSGSAAFPGANGKIAFYSNMEGNWEIYVLNADGTGQTNLTNNPATDAEGAWSPDGQKIAFASYRDGNGEIYVMNADGTGATRLTNNPAWDAYATWSPDGQKIAFASNRDGNAEIYIMNADGTGATQLTNNSADDIEPTWSPDGTEIAFTTYRDGAGEVYLMNPDGTGQINCTNNPAADTGPDWSPDGTKIAFSTGRVDGIGEVFVMNADCAGASNLSNTTVSDPWWAHAEGAPRWSPDGTKIAFPSNRDGNWKIYVMNADGTGQALLTNNPVQEPEQEWLIGWQPLVVYGFSGFFPPVDNPGPGPSFVFNVAKAGSGIPIKFSLNGDQGPDIFAWGYPKSQQVACDASATFDGIEQTVTAGSSSLSYDAASDRYVYVWKSDKAWANTCRKLTVRLKDSTDHVAYFEFTK